MGPVKCKGCEGCLHCSACYPADPPPAAPIQPGSAAAMAPRHRWRRITSRWMACGVDWAVHCFLPLLYSTPDTLLACFDGLLLCRLAVPGATECSPAACCCGALRMPPRTPSSRRVPLLKRLRVMHASGSASGSTRASRQRRQTAPPAHPRSHALAVHTLRCHLPTLPAVKWRAQYRGGSAARHGQRRHHLLHPCSRLQVRCSHRLGGNTGDAGGGHTAVCTPRFGIRAVQVTTIARCQPNPLSGPQASRNGGVFRTRQLECRALPWRLRQLCGSSSGRLPAARPGCGGPPAAGHCAGTVWKAAQAQCGLGARVAHVGLCVCPTAASMLARWAPTVMPLPPCSACGRWAWAQRCRCCAAAGATLRRA